MTNVITGLLKASNAKVNKDGGTAVITIPKHRSFLKKSIEGHGDEIARSINCLRYKIFISDEEVKEDYKVKEFRVSIIKNPTELIAALSDIQGPFSLDFETTSLNTYEAQVVGVGVSHKGGTFYVPTQHIESSEVMSHLKLFLEGTPYTVIFHNAKYELKIFKRHGIDIDNFYDTMLPIHLSNSEDRKSLKKTVERLFHIKMTSYEDVTKVGKKKISFLDVPIDKAAEYCGGDAYYTYKIWEHYNEKLSSADKQIIETDIQLTKAILTMEENGILLDLQHFKKLKSKIEGRLMRIEKIIYALAGIKFNIASTKQLSGILYDALKIHAPIYTKKGNLCTNDKALKVMADNRLVKHLIQYRSLSKLLSTYIVLPEKVEPTTGRIHGNFNICGTATFRLSSSDPNLQNLPAEGLGKEIRRGIIAPPGSVLIAADYSQIELRLFALLANDEKLLHAFAQGDDPHRTVTATLLEKPLEDVTQEDRRLGKTLNFAILYMTGKKKVAEMLGIDVEKAGTFIEKYYAAIPNLKPLIESTLESARESGSITTMFGRKRYFPAINSRDFSKRHAAEREAFNATIQSAAAEIMRKAIIKFNEVCPPYAKLVLSVHDEIVVECREDKADEVMALLIKIMSEAVELKVALEVEASMASNYGDAK